MYWYGETYLWFLNHFEQNIIGCITPITSEKYLDQDMLHNKIISDDKTVINSEITDAGIYNIYCEAATFVIYTLHKGETEFTVAKYYCPEDDTNLLPFKPSSNTIPDCVYVFVKKGQCMYVIILESFVVNITDETILSIGMEKYIPPVAELEPQPDHLTE